MHYHAAPLKSGKVTENTEQFPCKNMVGLGFNNTGETTAKIGHRTIAPGAGYEVNGNNFPISQEYLPITFEGEGKNELEYTAQIIPAKYICNE